MNVILKYLISLLLLCTAEVAWGQVDSVMKIISSLPHDTVRLAELKRWCVKTIDTPDELIYLDAILKEASAQGDIDYQAFAHRNIVRHHFNIDSLEQAEQASEQAIPFLRKQKRYALLFDVRSMLISMYTELGEYEMSLWKGHEMYKEAEALGDDCGKVSACYVLAHACYVSQRYRKAIEWCKQGLHYTLTCSDKPMLEAAELLFMAAESHYSLNMIDSMKQHVDLVYQVLSAYSESESKSISEYYSFYKLWMHCRYATYCLHHNDLKGAYVHLSRAGEMMKWYKYGIYKDLYHYIWSDYYLALGKHKEAMENLDKARAYEREWLPEDHPEYLKRRASIYYAMGDYQTAAYAMERGSFVIDSTNGARFAEQSRQLRSVYDMNRLEAESEEWMSIIYLQIFCLLALGVVALLLFYSLYHYYRIKRELNVAVEKAREADEKTSGFLSNMSREVQMFLQELSDLSDALIRESEVEKKQMYATEIRSRNERAQHVIFDILDVSKIESDRMQFQYEEISLNGLLEEACSSVLQQLPDRVKVRFVSSEERLFTADPVRLNQVLCNLLRYAGEHTREGFLDLCYENSEQDVRFILSGENWVMTPQEYESLFDRLVQTSGKLEDMRLDMLISRGLILKMGGRLTIFPAEEGGTRLELVLPDWAVN